MAVMQRCNLLGGLISEGSASTIQEIEASTKQCTSKNKFKSKKEEATGKAQRNRNRRNDKKVMNRRLEEKFLRCEGEGVGHQDPPGQVNQ
jgi:hypothetical protein